MTLKGYKQTPEQTRKIVEATAKAREAWTEERRNLFRLRVTANNKAGTPEVRAKNSISHMGKHPTRHFERGNVPWNKGNNWRNKYTIEEQRAIVAERARDFRKHSIKRRINESMGAMIYQALKTKKNGHKWEDLVDYSLEGLMSHLENQFKNGMSWDNKGQWHIDHIVPRSSFHFNSPEDNGFRECWALSNLQPLWSNDNLRKRNMAYNSQLKLVK